MLENDRTRFATRQVLQQIRLPLLVAAVLLQLAVVANLYVKACLLLAALLSSLVFWSARPSVGPRSWRWFALLLVVNLLAQGIYLWTMQERTHIVVRFDPDQGTFSAATNQDQRHDWRALEWKWDIEGRPSPTSGGIALWLPDRAYSDHHFLPYPSNLIGWLAEKIDASNLKPAWDNIVVRDNATGKVLWQSRFDNQQAADWRDPSKTWSVDPYGAYSSTSREWTFAGADDWTNYTLEADILRARNVVGLAVLTRQDALENGVFVLIQPWNEAWQWGTWDTKETFKLQGPWVWFRKPLSAHIQETLSLYVKTWQYAVLIALIVALGATVLQLFAGLWRGRRDHDWTSAEHQLDMSASPPLAVHVAQRSREVGFESAGIVRRVPRSTPWAFYTYVGLVGLLATLITTMLCLIQLEAIPHVQDSVSYYFQAKILAMGHWYVPLPPSPEFFEFEYVAQHDGKWFSIYQPGYPILLAIGMLIRAPWLINPLLAAGTLVLVALTGQRMFNSRVGLLAALLGLCSPFFLQLSASFMSHATAGFFIALFLYTVTRIVQQPVEAGAVHWLMPLLVGVSAAWTFITRPYTAVLLVAPLALYIVFVMWRRPMWWRWLFSIVGAVPVLSLMLVFNWVTTGNPLKNTWTLSGAGNRLGFAQQGIGMRNGHTLSDGLHNTTVNTLELMRYLYGWPLFVTLAFLLLPFVLGAARRWDWLLLASAAALIIGYIAYWPPGIMYGPRYYYEMLPMLLLLTGRGVDVLAKRAGQIADSIVRRRTSQELGWVVVGLVLVGLLFLNLVVYLPHKIKELKGYNYTNAARLRAVADADIHNAVVFVEGSQDEGWWTYGSVFPQNDPLLRGDIIYARDLGDARNFVLLASFPERTPYRLTKDNRLVPLDYTAARTAAFPSTAPVQTIAPP